MAEWITVASTGDLKPGERTVLEVDGEYIALFNVGGTFYALEDICPHDDGRFVEEDAHLDGLELECARHGARFDLRTGKRLSMPAVTDVRWYPVQIDGDAVQIKR